MRARTKLLLLVGLATSSLALIHCVGDEPAGGSSTDDGGVDSGTPDNFVPQGDGGNADTGADAGPGQCLAGSGVTCGAGVNPCIVQIAAGGSTFCARDNNCNLYCWGANAEGQLGKDPTTAPFSATPVKIDLGGLLSVGVDVGGDFDPDFRGEGVVCSRVAAEFNTSATIMCWGANRWGQLGLADAGTQIDDGGFSISTKPTMVPSLSNIAVVNAGARHECVITAAGLIDCWGDNTFGELGRPTTGAFDPTPLPITFGGTLPPEADSVVGVSYTDTCILDSTKHVYCVGADGQKQLANDAGDDSNASAPFTLINGVTNAVGIITNGRAICALTATKTLLCWGQNDHQQMGNGTAPKDQIVPSSPSGLASGVGGAQAGGEQFCVNLGTLPSDGGVTPNILCWGGNGVGQSTPPTDGGDLASPTSVGGLPPGFVTRIAAGGEATCVLMNDGRVWCWGQNSSGALGARDGTNGNDGTVKGPGLIAF